MCLAKQEVVQALCSLYNYWYVKGRASKKEGKNCVEKECVE